jgi:muramoyltetrapeptide carboxypeptidase
VHASKLAPGDTIGLISPSHVATPEHYAPIIAALEALGFAVKCGDNLYKDTFGTVASDTERAADFNAMIRDDQVRMILFSGGEGAEDLLPLLDYQAAAENPKLLCSYSDGTTILNAITAQTGLVTYYGQSPGEFADLRHYDYSHFTAHFLAEQVSHFEKKSHWETLSSGKAEGRLIGGYTRNFALLLGSPTFSYNKEGEYLLFLEDHEKFSDVGAVGAYLTHIEQQPFMERVRGLLFGHYATPRNEELLRRLERFGAKNGIPVVYCDDFGHGVNHGILPIGKKARLDADGGGLWYLWD